MGPRSETGAPRQRAPLPPAPLRARAPAGARTVGGHDLVVHCGLAVATILVRVPHPRLGLDIPAAAEVDEAWQDLTAAGYRGYLQPWDAFWGKRYAVVLDPDGRPVDLFATLGSV